VRARVAMADSSILSEAATTEADAIVVVFIVNSLFGFLFLPLHSARDRPGPLARCTGV